VATAAGQVRDDAKAFRAAATVGLEAKDEDPTDGAQEETKHETREPPAPFIAKAKADQAQH